MQFPHCGTINIYSILFPRIVLLSPLLSLYLSAGLSSPDLRAASISSENPSVHCQDLPLLLPSLDATSSCAV